MSISRDHREAVSWYRKAAAQGDAQAEYRLGFALIHGSDGVTRDVPQGLSLMENAGNDGYVHSFYELASLYRAGRWSVPEDATQSAAWFKKAAEQGGAASQAMLGVDYQYGRGVAKDVNQAISWYRKAASQGNTAARDALVELGEK